MIPKLNPALAYKSWPVNLEIFNYPKWKDEVPEKITEEQFNKAWKELFIFEIKDCLVDYGNVTIFENKIKGCLTIQAPFAVHYIPFEEYTDEPILSEGQTFYYDGHGCNWSTDAIGQRFYLIDPKTGLPDDWPEAYNWEIIKRYTPFTTNLFK